MARSEENSHGDTVFYDTKAEVLDVNRDSKMNECMCKHICYPARLYCQTLLSFHFQVTNVSLNMRHAKLWNGIAKKKNSRLDLQKIS